MQTNLDKVQGRLAEGVNDKVRPALPRPVPPRPTPPRPAPPRPAPPRRPYPPATLLNRCRRRCSSTTPS